MDKWDLIEQAFFDGTFDAAWNESEHPREGGKDAEPKKGMVRISVNPSKIGHRMADIGPGGKEHNVKTSVNWPTEKKPKAKDAGRPYQDTITTRALGGKRSTRTFAPPKGGLPAGPSFARKQGLGARVGKGVRHAIGQPRLFPHKG